MANDNKEVSVAYHELATLTNTFNKDNQIIFGDGKDNGVGISKVDFANGLINLTGKDLAEIKTYLLNSKPYLDVIRAENGAFDPDYIKMGSVIYNSAMSHLIYSYEKQKALYIYQKKKNNNSTNLQKMYNEVMELFNLIQDLPMDDSCRSHFYRNKTTIVNHQNKDLSNEGCYIATMVYGDYNHPQVIVLRQFRDNVLRNSCLGRCFIAFYYCISPGMVKVFKNATNINRYIKSILDYIVKCLSKNY